MAEVVAADGLVEVMRDMLAQPESYAWLSTRLEIARLLRTDAGFQSRWQSHQKVLDMAVRQRLQDNAELGRMRDDMPIEVLHAYLETVLEGFISRLATGSPTDEMARVLDLVEESIRSAPQRP